LPEGGDRLSRQPSLLDPRKAATRGAVTLKEVFKILRRRKKTNLPPLFCSGKKGSVESNSWSLGDPLLHDGVCSSEKKKKERWRTCQDFLGGGGGDLFSSPSGKKGHERNEALSLVRGRWKKKGTVVGPPFPPS